jgi:hypothetical protein
MTTSKMFSELGFDLWYVQKDVPFIYPILLIKINLHFKINVLIKILILILKMFKKDLS